MKRSVITLLCTVAAWPQDQAGVRKILNMRCTACHNAQLAKANLRMDTWEAMAAGGISGPAVVAGELASSPLYQRLVTENRDHRMPPATAGLATAEIAVIKAWIENGAPGFPAASQSVRADFVRDIHPILRANCYECHSGSQPKAQLRLDSRAAALRGGVSGAVIVPGNSASSRLVHRVEGKGGEQRMPFNGQPLAIRQVAALKKWIDSGAPWPDSHAGPADARIEKHWSYTRVERPVPPTVNNAAQARNPVDRFVLAKIEPRGFKLSAEASRETLIRRLSLDLTGLPPPPAEIDAFLADRGEGAYERLVERLLKSPHYGERWARPWLDLARYADTNGYEKDNRRTMWAFRDWVIGALNRDLGYDQFTIEQLAGDLLPAPTRDQRIATGFHRNTMFNEEGGVDREEAHFEVLVDRVNTTGSVWLATTFACTQCHNHKYDPVTQRDYYSMMAFFSNTIKRSAEEGMAKWREPQIDLATAGQESRRAELSSRKKELDSKLATQTPDLDQEQAAWEAEVRAAESRWQPLVPVKLESQGGAVLKADSSGVILASGANPREETVVIEADVKPGRISGLRIEAFPDPSLPRNGPGRDAYGNFIVTAVRMSVGGQPVFFTRPVADEGRVHDPVKRQLWVIDASREEPRLPRQLVLPATRPVMVDRETRVRVTVVQISDFAGQSMGRFRLSVTGDKDPATVAKVRHKLRPWLAEASRTSQQGQQVSEFFRTIAKSLEPARDELKEVTKRIDDLGIPTALVMEDQQGQQPFDFVRVRGGFAAKSDRVEPAVPALFGALPAGAPRNRLGLAQWLVSRDNPLTARVAVNRVWEQYFGRGIVETSEDFGSQGQRPSHPELLDWLAAELMENGWSLKHLHRVIVTSATYRQTSAVTPALLQADPVNRLLARGPRFRMEAEMVRDSALAASGLLSRTVGGPSVMPYQPPGIWDIPYSSDKWEESKGEDGYRRGLYTFIRRSAAYPSMMNFDATSREFCTVRRTRTNTPLQALTTLNDPAFFDTARGLGRRIQQEGGSGDRERAAFGFRLTTGRVPGASETDRLLTWLNSERRYFETRREEAAKLGGSEAAPWVMLANVLLNLDEALTKE